MGLFRLLLLKLSLCRGLLCHWWSSKKKGKGSKKYLKDTEWNALSLEAQSKIIEPHKKGKDDDEDDKSLASNKSARTIESLSKTMKFLDKDSHKKGKEDDEDDKSLASNKSAKTIKSLSKTIKFLEKGNRLLKKLVSMLQKCNEDDGNDSLLSAVEGSSHIQDAMEMLKEHHPKIVLALKLEERAPFGQPVDL